MQAGEIRYAAIVNMEFGMSAGGPVMPKKFSLQTSAGLTVGCQNENRAPTPVIAPCSVST